MTRAQLAERLARARRSTGLSVTQLAELAGVAAKSLRAFEEGEADMPLGQLERLATVLGLDSDVLVDECAPVDGYAAVLRSPRGTLRDDVGLAAVAHLGRVPAQVCLDRRRLERLLCLPPPVAYERFIPLPPPGEPEWREGVGAAERVRSELELGLAPVQTADLLASLGVGLVLTRFPDDQLWGLTLVDELHGPTVIVNLANRNHRFRTGIRFTVAHELFHVLFDRASGRIDIRRAGENPEEYDAYERRANAFAVNLLAPVEAVKRELARLGLEPARLPNSPAAIVHLVQKFGIGIRSLVDLLASPANRLVPREVRDALVERASAGVDRELYSGETFDLDPAEPWSRVPIERRGHFSLLALRAYEAGAIDRDELRQFLGLLLPSDLDPILAVIEGGAAPGHSEVG